MAVTESIVKKKLNIRIASNNSLQANLDEKSCEIGLHAKPTVSNGCNKRKAEPMLDGKRDKRRRMNLAVKQQCGAILQKLITHPTGCIFSTPVDPVALNIPDYFSIISNPMDLGTIKSKLASNRYFTAEEFASDVKLTFSNAMLYNPPDNPVHHMAKDLECLFIRRWKLLETKWKRETASSQQGMVSSGSAKIAQQDTMKAFYKKSQGLISSGIEKNAENTRKACCNKSQGLISSGVQKNAQCKKSDLGVVLVAKRSMSLEDKRELRKDLVEVLKGKMNRKLRTVLQKFGFFDIKKEKIDLDIDALHDDILWELKRVLKDISHATSAKDSDSKILSTQTRRLDLDSCCQLTEGSGSGLDEENTCPSFGLSTTVATAISGEDWNSVIDDEQDLKKALRVAMLKSRFAETISKVNGGKVDAQQERERVKRLLHEEEAFKARIREEQLKKEAELKRKREKQREAARLALHMMERSVEFEDNLMVLKEFEGLSECSPTYVLNGYGPVMVLKVLKTGEILKPLEQLGLHIKEEYVAHDDEDTFLSWQGEEGRS